MIMNSTRPDRQTLLFSATFPRKVEALARKVLRAPIEIVVGGRSVAASTIDHRVEVIQPEFRFRRLLKLMGEYHSKGGILIFVDSQKRCDQIYTELSKMGYQCLSLHSGKDQLDRRHSIDDFKKKVRTVMIATSLAGRGLDVDGLNLVVNYTSPNHLEDYVHRVGRTGRAGKKGTAWTFITPSEEQFSPDLVKALKDAGKEIPPALLEMANKFNEKVEKGEAKRPTNQFKGVKGYKFDPSELTVDQRNSKLERLQFEMDTGQLTEEERSAVAAEKAALLGYEKFAQRKEKQMKDPKKRAEYDVKKAQRLMSSAKTIEEKQAAGALLAQAIQRKAFADTGVTDSNVPDPNSGRSTSSSSSSSSGADPMNGTYIELKHSSNNKENYITKIAINDYPQYARYRIMNKDTQYSITEISKGVAIIGKGSYVPPGTKPPPGVEKLHLVLEATSEIVIKSAVKEINRILEEETMKLATGRNLGTAGSSSASAITSRYGDKYGDI
jgi:ATP-dependent RNA helicase DDX46/PRP5